MIDIIIPAYNAHDTITKTLSSIALQSIKDSINVYIIDDCSKKGYDEIVNDFSKVLNIKLLKTSINSGPGVSRQLGLDNSDGKYVVFIDADDLLYDCFSIENLYICMETKNLDCAIGRVHEERDDGSFCIYDNHQNCLHAKMYRRSFIDKHKFRFNNSSYSEDKAFNRLFHLANPKCEVVPVDVYVYNYNRKSLTKNDTEKYKSEYYIKGEEYNMHWIFEEAMKRSFDIDNIAKLMVDSLYEVHWYYNTYHDVDNQNIILKWGQKVYNDIEELSKYYDMDKYYNNKDEKKDLTFDEFIKIVKSFNN